MTTAPDEDADTADAEDDRGVAERGPITDGPSAGAQIIALVVRALPLVAPCLVPAALFGVVAAFEEGGAGRFPLVEMAGVLGFLGAALGILLLIDAVFTLLRSAFSQADRSWRVESLRADMEGDASGPALAWDVALLDEKHGRRTGVLVQAGRWLRIELRQGDVPQLDLHVEEIAAIETEPASIVKRFLIGSPLIVLILIDGRQIRLGAWQARRLEEELRMRLDLPEGRPAHVAL